MKKLIMSRGTGKTTLLVRRSAATNTPIVCATYDAVRLLKERAIEMGLRIPDPIPAAELKTLGRDVSSVLIDDADAVLRVILYEFSSCSIDIITLSPD